MLMVPLLLIYFVVSSVLKAANSCDADPLTGPPRKGEGV